MDVLNRHVDLNEELKGVILDIFQSFRARHMYRDDVLDILVGDQEDSLKGDEVKKRLEFSLVID